MADIDYYGDINLHGNQLKESRYENRASFPTTPGEGQVFYHSAQKVFYGWSGTTWINISQVVTNAMTIVGEIANANTNPGFPSSPTVGDTHPITTTAGTVGGLDVEIGDQLVYSTSGWFVLQRNLVAATTSIAGFIRLATQGETNSGALTDVAISPSTLAGFLANFLYSRKVVVSIVSLAANTPTDVTHGLNVAAAEDIAVQCYQGGAQIGLRVVPVSVNKVTVESNQTIGNVKIIVQG